VKPQIVVYIDEEERAKFKAICSLNKTTMTKSIILFVRKTINENKGKI
jgi:hypothetical protein